MSSDQIPYVTPVAFGTDTERLYLNIKHDSKKARNIKANSRVQFVIDDVPTFETFRGVLVSGKAELISSGNLHEIGRDLLYSKYPKYEEQFPIQEGSIGSKYILVITPTKIVDWGPIDDS
ncbi:MAG: pyridoxamine 5'-phosphate oxidase family protein [Candidatus Heimdallarchaeota archaeon]|nr:pyridoxamine 5'-phosphate oxidase family protein [Candidatus Heimdallarchaeota archaeon]